MKRPVVILGGLLVLGLLLAGCVSSPWGGETSSRDAEGMQSLSSSPAFPGGAGSGSSVSAPAPAADLDQKVIRTASINLEVANVSSALDELKAIAIAHGGYTGSLSAGTRYDDRKYATVTLRIPAGAFDAATADAKRLGTLLSESLSAEDVTEEYVDLQARRTALAGQLAQYTRIMERAGNVSEVLEVQAQIERVQVEIDRIDGRLKYLDNRVEYATVTVSLVEPEPVGGVARYSIISVINQGIAGFLAVTAGLVVILITLIPVIILVVVVYLGYRWWQRRKGGHAKLPEEKKTGGEKPPGP